MILPISWTVPPPPWCFWNFKYDASEYEHFSFRNKDVVKVGVNP